MKQPRTSPGSQGQLPPPRPGRTPRCLLGTFDPSGDLDAVLVALDQNHRYMGDIWVDIANWEVQCFTIGASGAWFTRLKTRHGRCTALFLSAQGP